jgi:hypothetical protein
LVVIAVALVLEYYIVTNCDQRQYNVNIYTTASKMADVDLGGAGLRTIIPQHVA